MEKETCMLELAIDLWVLIITTLISLWAVLGKVVDLIIINDPFWAGVEATLIVLIVWNNRKELIRLVDRIPLLGALVAKVLNLADEAVEFILSKLHSSWVSVRSKTWDRLVSWILNTDKELRK